MAGPLRVGKPGFDACMCLGASPFSGCNDAASALVARWRRGGRARASGITKQERAMAKGQQRSGREAKKPKADKKPAPAAGTQQYKLPAQTTPAKGGK